MRTRLLALVLVSMSGCVSSPPPRADAPVVKPAPQPPPPSELETIAALEDRRSFGNGALPTIAKISVDPEARARALLALGRLQDPAAIPVLLGALGDAEVSVRKQAAFSCGLLGLSWVPLSADAKGQLASGLLTAEASEQSMEVKLGLLDALGKVVTLETTARLIERLSLEGAGQGRAALALGIAVKNGAVLKDKAVDTLGGLLTGEHLGDVRYAAAYALAQAKAPKARPALLGCLTDESSEVRALCAKGLGDVGTDADAAKLQRLIDDADRRVAVEAARTLVKLAAKCRVAGCAPVKALGELSVPAERFLGGDAASAHPILAFAQSPLPASLRPQVLSLRTQLAAGKAGSAVQQHAVANLDCRLAAALDRLGGALKEVRSCGTGLIDEPRRLRLGLEGLSTTPNLDPAKRTAEGLAGLAHADPKVKLAAFELLSGGTAKSPTVFAPVRALLASEDLVVAGAAAGTAAKLKDLAALPEILALAKRAGDQVDVSLAVAEALGELGSKDAVPQLEVWLTSTNASVRAAAATALSLVRKEPVPVDRVELPVGTPRPAPIPAGAKLVVVTERGEIEIELFTTDAPVTSANLYHLAERGYFHNLTFHRIVPDFVVQGGDPRGDGEGGPGYAIRCEVNAHPYVRGTVGMALSGKDTGGSQFFVALAPQPHLDGRYTTFGQVTKGIELADGLLEGDLILDVRAVP